MEAEKSDQLLLGTHSHRLVGQRKHWHQTPLGKKEPQEQPQERRRRWHQTPLGTHSHRLVVLLEQRRRWHQTPLGKKWEQPQERRKHWHQTPLGKKEPQERRRR